MPIESSIYQKIRALVMKYKWPSGILVFLVILSLVSVTIYWVLTPKTTAVSSEVLKSTEMTKQSESTKSSDSSTSEIYVDVKGAVKHPGVYTIHPSARVKDIIQLAGGMTGQAEIRAINLAQKVSDQAVIYVPTVGEQVSDTWSSQQQSTGQATQATEKININTADASTLMTLNGIGEKKAQAIIDYRTQKGTFKQIEELKEVDGFGEKTVEKLKDSITIE